MEKFEFGYIFGIEKISIFDNLKEAIIASDKRGTNYVVIRDVPLKEGAISLKFIGWKTMEKLSFNQLLDKFKDSPKMIELLNLRPDKEDAFIYCDCDVLSKAYDKRTFVNATIFKEVKILSKNDLAAI